ncbi:hypothetical protein PybrP1_002796 [[Pythium] brassicae (nom. inval.)]|nr:hypothetical protein PybrP1_002796 [[Pythium] brassicae (nom. inval.)]
MQIITDSDDETDSVTSAPAATPSVALECFDDADGNVVAADLCISSFDGASRTVHDWLNNFLSAVEADELLHIAEDERVVGVLAEPLRAKYGRRESASQIFDAVMQRKKMPDETFEEFAEAVEGLGLCLTLEEEQAMGERKGRQPMHVEYAKSGARGKEGQEPPAGGELSRELPTETAVSSDAEAGQPAPAIKPEMPILTQATDGLLTATVELDGVAHELTIDTGARYSIIGQRLKAYGKRLGELPPVGSVLWLQGRLLAVAGVFCFRRKTVYGQTLVIDAFSIGCFEDELTSGLIDFLRRMKAIINHATGEVTYDNGDTVTLPFTCLDEDQASTSLGQCDW